MFGWLHRALVLLRWPVLLLWAAVTVGAYHYLPPLLADTSIQIDSVVPPDSPAIQVQRDAIAEFGVPLLSRISVVLRDPAGLTDADRRHLVDVAKESYQGGYPGFPELAAAVPVVNAEGWVPSSHETGTTAMVYLFFYPDRTTNPVAAAQRFADAALPAPSGGTSGVVGPLVAETVQGELITRALPIVELATILIVVLIVAARFRSVVAPLVTLLSAGISYVVTIHLLGWLGERLGFRAPGALEPLLVVLLIGVVTDYAVFFLAGFQDRMRSGGVPKKVMVEASRDISPIVATASLAVAAGTASLLVAHLELFRRLGPSMAITVLVTAIVAVTFIPALLAVLGRAALWPSRQASRTASGARSAEGAGRGGWREAVLRGVVHRAGAAVALLIGIGLLGAGSASLTHFRMGTNVVADLPGSAAPARALQEAATGFAPGIIAPTELVVSAPGVADRTQALADLQRQLTGQPGVAGVIGPDTVSLPPDLGVLLSPSRNAARYLLVLDQDPYSAAAVEEVGRLQQQLPALLQTAGLGQASFGLTGDSVLSREIVDLTQSDLLRVGGIALGVLFVILVAFLRALIAPLFLLLASAAVVAVSLGATSRVFDLVFDVRGPTFFMPLAVAVLLLAFGSDYNIFLVGRIREHSTHLPWRTAIVVGGAEASRAIGSAGLALAGSFAMLAIIPLNAFRQFAFAMALGVLLDTFLVRSYLVPAGLALLGRFSGWPGHRLGRDPAQQPAAVPPS